MIRFCNGEEALKFFYGDKDTPPLRRKGQSYLLLLDIRMPNIDGEEVLRRVKSDPDLKSMPVIMLTTTDSPQEVERCYALGCNVYLTKPVDFKMFAEILRRLGLFIMVINVPKI